MTQQEIVRFWSIDMWSKRANHVPFVQQLRSDAVAGQSYWIGSVQMLPLHGPIGKNRKRRKIRKDIIAIKTSIYSIWILFIPWTALLRIGLKKMESSVTISVSIYYDTNPACWMKKINFTSDLIHPRYNDYIVLK